MSLVRLFGAAVFVSMLHVDLAPAVEQPHAHANEIRSLVEDKINVAGPGVALFVARNGIPLHFGSYGLANVRMQKPITTDSVFDLASVSKQITGVAILTLIEAGQLEADDPVVEHVPEFAVPIKGRAVTVSDLLHHVSGLADYCSTEDWDGDDEEFAKLTPETHLEWLNTTKPRRAPGVKYEYNNSEYALLALVVERISAQSFAEYAREHLFDPAGMDDTVVRDGATELPAATVVGYAVRARGDPKISRSPTVMSGDGNVYTSIRDLARWDTALRQHTIISAKLQRLAWTNGRYDNGKPISDDDETGYGYGWVVEDKGALVSHTGSWDGTSTYLLMETGGGLTVAVLSNDENLEAGDLAAEIAALFEEE